MPTLPSAACAEPALQAATPLTQMVVRGLRQAPRQFEALYFYDELGSALFDAITRLPDYTITRAELEVLGRNADAILSPFSQLGATPELVELGPGNGEKLMCLLNAVKGRSRVHLIDISPAALAAASTRLHRCPGVEVTSSVSTFGDGLRTLPGRSGPRLVLFLGSNLGNLAMPDAASFLHEIRAALAPGDGLLLGLDLVKPKEALLAAYDDPLGVTAAFNKNLLVRINRELGSDFDLLAWDHRAVWNPAASRVEMHLVSVVEQTVLLPAQSLEVAFRAGEAIWTESSHKYREEAVRTLLAEAGFRAGGTWVSKQHGFLEALCLV